MAVGPEWRAMIILVVVPRGAHCKKLLACRRAERATEETSGNA